MAPTAEDPQRDVYWAARPLYLVSRAGGLACFSYASPKAVGPRVVASTCARVYALTLATALAACFGMYVHWALGHGYADARTLAVHLGMRTLVYACMVAAVAAAATVHRRAPREALAAVARADDALWRSGAARRRACARARLCAGVQLALAGSFFGGYVVADVATQAGRYHSTYDWAFHFVPHVVPHVFNVVLGLQYSNWLLLLWSRMRALNRRLGPLAEAGALPPSAGKGSLRRPVHKRPSVSSTGSGVGVMGAPCPAPVVMVEAGAEAHPVAMAAAAERLAPPEPPASLLRRLQKAHMALSEAGAHIDTALGFPVLLETCYLASELVSRTYALYRTGLARHALWLLVTGVRLAALAAPAHACADVARRTAELLGRASLAPPPDAEGRRALRDFARQAAAHQLRFTAAGVFAVDASLLLKVTVAAVTYIIVAVQFECKQKQS